MEVVVPAALDAITLQLTLRRLRALPTLSLGAATFCAVPFTRHTYENRLAARQLPRLQVKVPLERVRLGRLVLRGKAAGLAVRQIVPAQPSST